MFFFFFSSRRRHTRSDRDWSSDVCSSDLVQGAKGPRAVPIGEFHLLPGRTPERETVLEPGDLVTHVTLPPPSAGSRQVYLKLRDRASYEFALASAAVVITVAGGTVTRAR